MFIKKCTLEWPYILLTNVTMNVLRGVCDMELLWKMRGLLM